MQRKTSQSPPLEVAAVFARCPAKLRRKLLFLRALILRTAKTTPGVGELEETLKWNEPAYLTSQTKSGTTIRINGKPNSESKYAMYFNCNTNLVDTFRTLFPKTFRYRGDREIEFDVADKLPIEELKICIAMALTYHSTKR
jgi:hypothetical protein